MKRTVEEEVKIVAVNYDDKVLIGIDNGSGGIDPGGFLLRFDANGVHRLRGVTDARGLFPLEGNNYIALGEDH